MNKEPRRGRVRKVLVGIGIALAGVLVLYALISVTSSWGDRTRAVRQADEGYATAAPAGRAWAQEVAAALAPTLGEPVGRQEHLLCGTGVWYGGWFVSSHFHACHLLHIQLYRSPDDPHAAAAAVSDSRFDALLGPVDFYDGRDCALLRENEWAAGAPRTAARFVPAGLSTADSLPCSPWFELSPSKGGFEHAERVTGDLALEEASQGALLVVTWRAEVSSTSLGCRPFSVIFCSEPWWTDPHLPEVR